MTHSVLSVEAYLVQKRFIPQNRPGAEYYLTALKFQAQTKGRKAGRNAWYYYFSVKLNSN